MSKLLWGIGKIKNLADKIGRSLLQWQNHWRLVSLISLFFMTACSLRPTAANAPTVVSNSVNTSPVEVSSAVSVIPTPETPYPLNGKVLFHSNREGNFNIYLLDPKTEEVTRLTNSSHRAIEPVWSEAKGLILFAEEGPEGMQLYTMNSDGSDPKAVTNNARGVSLGGAWSSNGERVVYHSNKSGSLEVYLLDLTSGEETQLTHGPGNSFMPTLSPDGREVAYVTDNDDGSGNIYKIDLETKEVSPLVIGDSADLLPRWSPKGDKILFVSARYGPQQVFTMNADGSEQTQLSVGLNLETTASWAENGDAILYASFRDDDWEIYVMAEDGSHQTRLTNWPGEDTFPTWLPN